MLTVRLRPCDLQLWGFQTPTLSSVGSPYRPYHQTWVPGLTLDPPTPVGQCLEAFCALQDWRVPRGPPFPPNWPSYHSHLYKLWRKCTLWPMIQGFLWKFLSFQLSIGWKKEPCPFCGVKRESMRHLFGTCSTLALQPPPFQAFLQSSTSSNFSHTALVLWAIWKARNKATHEGQPFSPSLIPIIYLQELEQSKKWYNLIL